MAPPGQLAVTERVPDGSLRPRADGGSGPRVPRPLGQLRPCRPPPRRPPHRWSTTGGATTGSRQAVPLNTTLDGHVDDLLEVIDGRPAVVVGHSLWGDIALGAALRPGGPGAHRRRGRLRTPDAVAEPVAESRRARPPTRGLRHPIHGGAADAAERFFRRMVGDEAWERLPEAARAARRADGPALDAELRAIRLDEAPFDWPTSPCPAVFARGREVGRPAIAESVAWWWSTRRGPS